MQEAVPTVCGLERMVWPVQEPEKTTKALSKRGLASVPGERAQPRRPSLSSDPIHMLFVVLKLWTSAVVIYEGCLSSLIWAATLLEVCF